MCIYSISGKISKKNKCIISRETTDFTDDTDYFCIDLYHWHFVCGIIFTFRKKGMNKKISVIGEICGFS